MYSISTTTRSIRDGEVDGRDYFFTDTSTFEKKISQGFFLEHAKVHGNYYGTSRDFIDKSIAEEKIILLDIDVQGVAQLKNQGYGVVSIFVLPPNIDVLSFRLTSRGTDSAEAIAKRLENAKGEINCLHDYDYLVINDSLMFAVDMVQEILFAEQNRVCRYIDPIAEFYKKI
jgi:guanylate kinase